jgi:hypothetical protein
MCHAYPFGSGTQGPVNLDRLSHMPTSKLIAGTKNTPQLRRSNRRKGVYWIFHPGKTV